MKVAASELELLRPASLAEALALLRSAAPIRPLAGATDLYVEANAGTLQGRRFLDLWPLKELAAIEVEGDLLRIGALATFSTIARSPDVRERLPMLVEAALLVGGRQIQNRATLGGNIANASPAGDSLPVLAVAEATLVVRNAERERRVPFTAFYTGYRRTVLAPDELITAVEVPPLAGEQRFRKVGTRRAQAISKVVMAALVGPCPRIAVGSVAPTVVRLPATEKVLACGNGIKAAMAALRAEIRPIDDMRSTAAYRTEVAARLLRSFFAGA